MKSQAEEIAIRSQHCSLGVGQTSAQVRDQIEREWPGVKFTKDQILCADGSVAAERKILRIVPAHEETIHDAMRPSQSNFDNSLDIDVSRKRGSHGELEVWDPQIYAVQPKATRELHRLRDGRVIWVDKEPAK